MERDSGDGEEDGRDLDELLAEELDAQQQQRAAAQVGHLDDCRLGCALDLTC